VACLPFALVPAGLLSAWPFTLLFVAHRLHTFVKHTRLVCAGEPYCAEACCASWCVHAHEVHSVP
jgi:hypothetical protein